METTWLRRLDRLGVFASVGCAIHCMIAPLLLILAPMLGGIWVHPVSHLAIAGLVMPIAVFSLRRGFAIHGRRWIATAGTVGIGLVLLGAAWPWIQAGQAVHAAEFGACTDCCPTVDINEITGEWSLRIPPATVITLVGGIALVTAHLSNLRCCAHGCSSPAGSTVLSH